MSQETVSLYAVGDVAPRRDNPESIFALARPVLKQADILFGQAENVFSETGEPQVHTSSRPAHPSNIAALTSVGFHAMSVASNHSLDWGNEPLLRSIDLLRKAGIAVAGAGRNIDEARRPVIVERKGTRVAFLAYCSVLQRGYEARADKPGAAPLRATTAYEQVDWQAGTPPRVLSFCNREDLEKMVDDIKKVRPLVDVVVVSMHWGVHFVPSIIARYQKEGGYAAIDAGADLVLGHHAHILKGIEVYKGKAIFHSLGNFAFDLGPLEKLHRNSAWQIYRWEADPEYPFYLFPKDSRKTMVARCVISGKKIERVGYLPALVNKQSQPEILPRPDPRSTEVFDYVSWISKDQRLDTRFFREGDEVVVQ
ncbi:MAG: CapA family protein [Chloroflexi bacterium]|nr:CapA family protein [Chloroflexota bacterium]